ncbi:MAG: hypothetical protein KC964_02020 [Candidatus Omnitrophica bacterium]|nr:hypothetical protein [Candidatus Omnitrophota bacterium]
MIPRQVPLGIVIDYPTYLEAINLKVTIQTDKIIEELENFKRRSHYGIERAIRDFRFNIDLRGDLHKPNGKEGIRLDSFMVHDEWDDLDSISTKITYHFFTDCFQEIGISEIIEHVERKCGVFDWNAFIFSESASTPQFYLLQRAGYQYIIDGKDMPYEEVFGLVAQWFVDDDPAAGSSPNLSAVNRTAKQHVPSQLGSWGRFRNDEEPDERLPSEGNVNLNNGEIEWLRIVDSRAME